jgi:hypothetical protein
MQAKFHENPPSLQKLLVGDTQADWWLDNPTFIF